MLEEEEDFDEPEDERVLLTEGDDEPERLLRSVVPAFPVLEPRVRGEFTFSVLLRVYPLLSKMVLINLPMDGNAPLFECEVRDGRKYSARTLFVYPDDSGASDFKYADETLGPFDVKRESLLPTLKEPELRGPY